MSRKQSSKFESPWWYRQVPRDFMSSPDVMLMTAEECGSYFFLLQMAWLGGEDCTLPNDPARLARLGRVEKVSDLVLKQFEVDKEGRLFNVRLADEWKEALKRSKDAKNNAEKRWQEDMRRHSGGNAAALQGQSDANATNTNTNTQTKTNKKPQTMQAQVEVSSASNEALGSASLPNPCPSEAAQRVAGKLAAILGRDNLKPGTKTAWAELAQALVDAHGEQKVVRVMQHHLVDSPNHFWRGRVMAMKNFSRCFNTMLNQMQQGTAGTRATIDPLAQRAASLQTGHDFSALAKGDL